MEFLVGEEQRGQLAQPGQVLSAAPREKGIAGQGQLPQPIGDRTTPQRALVTQLAPCGPPAVQHVQCAVAGAMRVRPLRCQRNTSARGGLPWSWSQSLSTWRTNPSPSSCVAGTCV